MLASVLAREPQLSALPGTVPATVRQVLKACLQKDPKKRIHDMADVRLAISGAFETARDAGVPIESPRRSKWTVPAAAAAVVLVAALAAAAAWMLKPVEPRLVMRFSHRLGQEAFSRAGRPVLAISRDGRRLAYVADTRIYLRNLDEPDAKPIRIRRRSFIAVLLARRRVGRLLVQRGGDQEDSTGRGQTGRVDEGGKSSRRIVGIGRHGSSTRSTTASGVCRPMAASPSSSSRPLTGERIHSPQMLPDGNTLLFAVTGESALKVGIKGKVVASDSMAVSARSFTRAAPIRATSTGHVVYMFESTLFALPFDAGTLQVGVDPSRSFRKSCARSVHRPASPSTPSPTMERSSTSTGARNRRSTSVMSIGPAQPQVAAGIIGLILVPPRFSSTISESPSIAASDDANIWIYDRPGPSGGSSRSTVGNARCGPTMARRLRSARATKIGKIRRFRRRRGAAWRNRGSRQTPAPTPGHPMEKCCSTARRPASMSFSSDEASERGRGRRSRHDPTPGRHPHVISRARFSPGGRWVAYTARY